MLVFLSTLPWCYDAEMSIMHRRNTVNIMKGLRKIFLKKYLGLFASTPPNCYMCINYVINISKTFIKIMVNKQNLICTSIKNILFK